MQQKRDPFSWKKSLLDCVSWRDLILQKEAVGGNFLRIPHSLNFVAWEFQEVFPKKMELLRILMNHMINVVVAATAMKKRKDSDEQLLAGKAESNYRGCLSHMGVLGHGH